MRKKNNKSTINNPIIPNTCPNCGEKHCIYISGNGKRKVIDFGISFEVGFLREVYYYDLYHCSICGHEWKVRKYIKN